MLLSGTAVAAVSAFLSISAVLALGFSVDITRHTVDPESSAIGGFSISSSANLWSAGFGLALATMIPLATGAWIGKRLPHTSWRAAALAALGIASGVVVGVVVAQALEKLVIGAGGAVGGTALKASLENTHLTFAGATVRAVTDNLAPAVVFALIIYAVASTLLVLSGTAVGGWLRRRRIPLIEEAGTRQLAERILGPARLQGPSGVERLERLTKLLTALGPLLTFLAAVLGSVLTFIATLLTAAARK